jgi:hypothetical protein
MKIFPLHVKRLAGLCFILIRICCSIEGTIQLLTDWFTQHDDGGTHFDTYKDFGHGDQRSQASLEDLCRSHLVSLHFYHFLTKSNLVHDNSTYTHIRVFVSGSLGEISLLGKVIDFSTCPKFFRDLPPNICGTCTLFRK